MAIGKWVKGLLKTSAKLVGRLKDLLTGRKVDEDMLDELLERTRDAVDGVDNLPACRRLGGTLDREALRRLSARAARSLLDRLVAEREGVA